MLVVGLNSGVTDANLRVDGGGACVVSERGLEVCIAEERLARQKYKGGVELSLPYVLNATGIEIKDVDAFALSFYASEYAISDELLRSIASDVGIPAEKLVAIPSHHLSHAYAAFSCSPFDRAIVLVMDNEGSILGPRQSPHTFLNPMERNSYYLADSSGFKLIGRDFAGASEYGFGKLYNKVTRHIGFGSYHNAGKTMGLAGLGDPDWFSDVEAFQLEADGSLSCSVPDTGDGRADLTALFSKFGRALTAPRQEGEPFHKEHLHLAAFVQRQLEKWCQIRVDALCDQFACRDVCIGGGVGLNSVMNRSIQDSPKVERLFIQPACTDQGQCIGNALWVDHERAGRPPTEFPALQNAYMGRLPEIKRTGIEALVRNYDLEVLAEGNIADSIARRIANGEVIGWFQGRSEMGPRALGHRSILADPRNLQTKDFINSEIKRREWFRPFAPVVLEEHLSTYFDLAGQSPYMLLVCSVKLEWRPRLPGITHYDGTARVQTVNREQNPLLCDLLMAFERHSGIPMLLNTSFNGPEAPIVETVEDAIVTMAQTPMDALVVGDFLIARPPGASLDRSSTSNAAGVR